MVTKLWSEIEWSDNDTVNRYSVSSACIEAFLKQNKIDGDDFVEALLVMEKVEVVVDLVLDSVVALNPLDD